jgi:hypothetical protein
VAIEIIILSMTAHDGADPTLQYAFWIYPTAAHVVPKPGATSAWRGAQAADIAALQAGTVIEEVYSAQVPTGTTVPAAQAYLQAAYVARVAKVAAQVSPNLYYGSTWDGTTWTMVTNP